jgi:hypothetical protein
MDPSNTTPRLAARPHGTQAATALAFEPVADTSIFNGTAGSDGLSDGVGLYLWLAVTAEGLNRRALVRFDLASILAGSVVLEARLTLYESRSREDHAVRLHRLLRGWGEGGSNAGSAGNGAPAQAGDATWTRARFPDQAWTTPGGDFVAAPSASTLVGGPGQFYTWGPTPSLVQDVQGWIDAPSSNHGWILIGNETGLQNAKRFESRHGSVAANRPGLSLLIEPPAPLARVDTDIPVPAWSVGLLGAGLAWMVGRRTRNRGG